MVAIASERDLDTRKDGLGDRITIDGKRNSGQAWECQSLWSENMSIPICSRFHHPESIVIIQSRASKLCFASVDPRRPTACMTWATPMATG